MEKIFGIPSADLMRTLIILVAIVMAILAAISLRNRVILKLGVRNIPRRRAQTMLIVAGLTLSTVIIASALGTGDTMTYSMRSQAIEALGQVDEQISPPSSPFADSLFNLPGAVGGISSISQERYEQIRAQIQNEPLIDGITPAIKHRVALQNKRSGQGEPTGTILAVGEEYDSQFGGLQAVNGSAAITALAEGEVYLSTLGAEKLAAQPGDTLTIYPGPQPVNVTVKAIVENSGLGNNTGPVVVMPLAEAQRILNMPGQISSIFVSNKGDAIEGAEHSQAVTEKIRVLLIKEPVAEELATLLRTPEVRSAIDAAAKEIPEEQKRLAEQVGALQQELDQPGMSDRLRSLMADDQLSDWIVGREQLAEAHSAKLVDLFSSLSELRVNEVKARAIDEADQIGSMFTNIFVIFGSFSVIAGILLIFMLFVMLAAERKSEMGMARAVGMQRRHLIQMFATEGMVYDMLAALLGVFLGLGISYVMVRLIAAAFGNFSAGEGLQIRFHMEPRSLAIAYCLGVLLTFLVVTFSSWRVSRLNIVAAIRDLPEELEGKKRGLLRRIWSFFRGPLLVLIGLAQINAGYATKAQAAVLMGVSLIIIGSGLFAGWLLERTSLRAAIRDRIVYSFIGVALLVFWTAPFGTWDALLGLDELSGGFETFVLAGVMQVAGAIWTVMYNTDLLLAVLNRIVGSRGSLAPVLKTAIAYPLSARFRTGMALAMFALIIFTIITMSVIIQAIGQVFDQRDRLTGGFDIQAVMGGANPVADLETAIKERSDLQSTDIEAIGAVSILPLEVRQIGASKQSWSRFQLAGYDQGYIEQVSQHQTFMLRAPGYNSDAEVWQALRERNDVAIIGEQFVRSKQNPPPDEASIPFLLDGVYKEDEQLKPIEIELREPTTGTVRKVQLIGVLDTTWTGNLVGGIQVNAQVNEQIIGRQIPPALYFIKVREGADVQATAQALERAFLTNGMNAEVLDTMLKSFEETNRAINQLLEGFMALGLLVGIAALGVISSRSVVERRQQIGMLRAIGYRRRMIRLSFILESSFIALLGIAIGTALGLNTGWNVVNEIAKEQPGISFNPPWIEILVIVLLAYGFSLLTTIIPARQAANIYPAEALRYE